MGLEIIQTKIKIITWVFILMLLSFSNAFSGSWKSTQYRIDIKYDDNVWAIIDDLDTKEDTYIALIDNTDGSSLILRVEHMEDALEYDDELLGEHLADGLKKADPELKIINTSYINVSGEQYYSLLYRYNNKKYGMQHIRHAIKKKEKYIIMLMMSWPIDMELNNMAPIKFMSFLNGMKLGDEK